MRETKQWGRAIFTVFKDILVSHNISYTTHKQAFYDFIDNIRGLETAYLYSRWRLHHQFLYQVRFLNFLTV